MAKFGRRFRGPGLFFDVLGTGLRFFGDGWVPNYERGKILDLSSSASSAQIAVSSRSGEVAQSLMNFSRLISWGRGQLGAVCTAVSAD